MRIFKFTFAAMLAMAVALTSCKKDDPSGGDSHTPIKMMLADSCHVNISGIIKAKRYFTYNAYGLPIETRRVKAEGGSFVNDTLIKRGFDKHRNLLFEERYVWKNDFWNTVSKREYTYNENDSVMTLVTYKGNGDVSGWSASEKYEYDYDKSGVLIKHNQYVHMSGDKFQLRYSLKAFLDAETGLCAFATESSYDNNDVETPLRRTEYTRYDDGKVKSENVSVYRDNVWEPYCLSEFTYDANGNKTQEIGSIYNKGTNKYDKDLEISCSYTSDSKLTKYERKCKFDGESAWTVALLVENDYNAAGKIVKYHYEAVGGKFRDDFILSLVKSIDCTYKYDNAGCLIEEAFDYNSGFDTGFNKGVNEYFNSEHVF